MRWRLGWIGFAIIAMTVACSASQKATDGERICTAGAYVFCRCQDRTEGTKKCHDDGEGFDECLPCDGSGDPGIGSGGTDPLGSPEEGSRNGDTNSEGTTDDPIASSGTPTSSQDAGSVKDAAIADARPTKDAPPVSSQRDSGTSASPPPSPNVTAAHCKPLNNIAPRIELQKVPDDPGTASGGKPAKGVYVQSWAVELTGVDGTSGSAKIFSRTTMEIGDGVGRYVIEDDSGKSISGGFRLTSSGNRITVAYECPAAPPAELTYDVNGASLTLYDPPYARVFVLQSSTAGGDR